MTIMSAIDYVNDKLAGSDQPAAATIEDAIRLMADNIGGGGELSPATADTLGGVKIGEGISVTSDGTISVGGGYDAVISLDSDSLDSVSTATLEAGAYATMKAKALDGEPLNALVYGINRYEGGGVSGICNYIPAYVSYNDYDENKSVMIYVSNQAGYDAQITITSGGVAYELFD